MAVKDSKQPRISLAALPYDLLHAIVAHLPAARSLAALSQTSRSLHTFVTSSGRGWQIFVQSQFPSIYSSLIPHDNSHLDDHNNGGNNSNSNSSSNNKDGNSNNKDGNIVSYKAPAAEHVHKTDWRKHAQHLTLLSLNYDRRGFLAQRVDPEIFIPGPPSSAFSPNRRHRQQHNHGHGHGHGHGRDIMHRWSEAPSTSGRQTVGFHPVLDAHTSPAGGETLAMGAGPDLLIRKRELRGEKWVLYRDSPASVAGKDDITALRLTAAGTRALVGRANGKLETVDLAPDGKWHVHSWLDTGGRTVKSTALQRDALAAAVLGNECVALYSLLPSASSSAVATLPLPDDEQPWTAAFLTSTLLAVGKTAASPLALHSITPSSITSTPTRTFTAESCCGSGTALSSVFPISPLADIRGPSSSLFLAGWYHGSTLLHDLRSPRPFESAFVDPLDMTSAVYSLLPLGRERILVGGARHNLLKIFDLRMPGGRVYSAPSSVSPPPGSPPAQDGWATYLTQQPSAPRRSEESPVYALAAANSGARVFAGVEGRVWEFDFAGDAAMHQFPIHPRRRSGSVSVDGNGGRRAWNSRSCTMYEFVGRTRLWRQGPEGLMGHAGGCDGRLDARWGEQGREWGRV